MMKTKLILSLVCHIPGDRSTDSFQLNGAFRAQSTEVGDARFGDA